MGTKEQQKMYKETQSSITKILEKGKIVDKKLIENQLLLINQDIASNDESLKKAAITMLEFLVNSNCEYVQTEIVKQLNDNADNKLIQSLFSKSVRKKITDNIMKSLNICEILLPWKNQNTTMLINILEEICLNKLPRDKCKSFFMNEVIPTMMSTNTDENVRDILSDIAFMLSTAVSVFDLTSGEFELFLEEVGKKYITAISHLRDKDQPNWHNLWIFLVRFCDKKIHSSMELTNRLLRVVEFAFRSSSIQQRLRGYDCWKELIDNASLDMDYICSSKQIKLLITPLRAKFSKQEIVISKRFDVFAYLLVKLQHKAVLCLREFLEFCFGPVGGNKDESRTGQGRSVLVVRLKSTKMLMEIIGHSHGRNVDCLVTESSISLKKALINHNNFATFHHFIINSVAQCCILLRESDMESKKMQAIKCLWTSVFNLIIPPSDMRLKYFQLIANILDDYIILSDEHLYFEDLLGLIFTTLISFDKDSNQQIHECVQFILKQLITIFFSIGSIPHVVSEQFKKIVSHVFSQIMLKEEKLKMIEVIIKCFSCIKASGGCASNIAKIWMCLNSELISDLAADKIEEFGQFRDYFLWPAHNLHFLDDKAKKQIVFHWTKLYRKLSSESEDKKLVIMKHLELIFKNNPLVASNVVSLLSVMSQSEIKFTTVFVTKLLEVLTTILVLPNLHTEDEQKISALVIQYFDPSLECYKAEDNDEVIKSICTSIEHILCKHEGFKLLEPFANFIRNCTKAIRIKFSKHLESLLLDMFTKENDTKSYNAKELSKVLGVFSEKDPKEDKKTFVIPSGRSARIASLAKSSPKTPLQCQKVAATTSPTALRLFGKDPETMSPLRARGSQLDNVTPTKHKKISNMARNKAKSTPSINEEDSSDFIKIDTEVKLQPSKLNEHQKEIMKKRREDIPALYQDLSQSLSQDYFSSKSNSKDAVDAKEKNKIIGDDPKVVVEKIESSNFSFKGNEGLPEPEDAAKLKNNLDIIENEQTKNVVSKEVSRAVEINEKINSESDLFPEDIRNLPMEDVQSGNIISTSVDEKHMINEQSNYTKVDFKGFEGGQLPHSRDLISQDLKQSGNKANQGTMSEDLFSDGSPTRHPIEDTEEIKLNVSGIEGEKTSGKKKKKIDAELGRLKMDIVGADKFFESKRRTRPKEKPKKFEEAAGGIKKAKTSPPEQSVAAGKKMKTSPTEETVSSDKKMKTSPTKNRRSSINFNKTEIVIEKNRRKTIGVIQKSDLKKSFFSPVEMKNQEPRKTKESTDDAKPFDYTLSKKILDLPDPPQQKSKELKTPLGKRKSIKLQDGKAVEESKKVPKLNKAEQQKPTEQDLNSVPNQPKLNDHNTPTGKNKYLKQQEVNLTEDIEMVHMPKEVHQQEANEQKSFAKRKSTKLKEVTADIKDELITEINKSDEQISNGNDVSADSVAPIVLQEESIPERVESVSTIEKSCQRNNINIENSLKENCAADNLEMAAVKTGHDIREPVEQEIAVDVKHSVNFVEEVEDSQDIDLVSRQMQVVLYNTNQQKIPISENNSVNLQDMEALKLSAATFTMPPKKSSEEVEVFNASEDPKRVITEFAIGKENETSTIDDETPDIFIEKRGEKRKHSTDDEEDFIESSQESFADLTPRKKNQLRVSIEQNANSDENTMVQQKTVTAADFISDIGEIEKNCRVIVEKIEVFQKIPQVEVIVENKQNIIEENCMEKTTKGAGESKEHLEEIPEKVEQGNIKLSEVPMQIKETMQIKEFIPTEQIPCQPTGTLEDIDGGDISKEANTTQDTTLTQDSTQDSFQAEENIQAQVGTQDTMTQPPSTQETPTQQDNCSMSEDIVPPTLYFDLPKKPNLTESEQMMCRLDTMSICVAKDDDASVETRLDHQSVEEIQLMATAGDDVEKKNISPEDTTETSSTNSAPSSPVSFGSPNRSNSLPSSPITVDTPTRTTKLLDDTMDISPIASNSSSPDTDLSDHIPVASQLFFRDDIKDLGEMEIMMKLDNEADNEGDSKKVPWRVGLEADDMNGGSTSSDDSDGILNDLRTVPSGLADLEFEAAEQDDNVSSSYDDLGTDENAQIQNGNISRNSFRDPSTIQERSSKLLNMINVNSPVSHNLIFKRRIGGTSFSPSVGTSSPSGGRIRKLMSNFCPKQTVDLTEEISEDDILTFSREIPSPLAVPKSSILKRKFSDTGDIDGISPCAKRKRVNFSDPCLTSKKLFIKDDFQPSLEAKRLFDPIPEPKSDDNFKDILDVPGDVESSDQMSETENIETEPSLDILNPMILRKDRPIYPKLVDCKEDLAVIMKRITSPMFTATLKNMLKSKKIKTIGDLAQQSETEINRFPFKVPVVANVFRTLDSYYRKKGSIVSGESVVERVNGVKEKEDAEASTKTVIPKVDIASELSILMQRATKENYPMEDMANVVLSSLDKQKVIALVKSHQSSISVTDFLEETNHNIVLKILLEHKTISEVLKSIHESSYADRTEEYFNSIADYTSSTVPLEKLLRGLNLKEIIEFVIKQNSSGKKEVLENFLLPLIESPRDIYSYLNSISMVDFGNIVINRLETEDLGTFLVRLNKSFPQTFVKTACDNCIVSPEDITSSFKNAVESYSGDKKTEVLIDMFKFISEKLDVNTLLSLHIEFLKRIPSMTENSGK